MRIDGLSTKTSVDMATYALLLLYSLRIPEHRHIRCILFFMHSAAIVSRECFAPLALLWQEVAMGYWRFFVALGLPRYPRLHYARFYHRLFLFSPSIHREGLFVTYCKVYRSFLYPP